MATKSLPVHAIVAFTCPTALLTINKVPSLVRVITRIRDFSPDLPITIALPEAEKHSVVELLEKNRLTLDLLICDPNSPKEFAQKLHAIITTHEAVLIYDASRPLTRREQFEKLFTSLIAGADAIRPSIAFTETLKIIDGKSIIQETLDRTSVKRIQSPELIRCCAIDSQGVESGFSLPLKTGARCEYIEGIPEGLRANNQEDLLLLESFLRWQESND